MATQCSFIKLNGTIGDVTFIKTGNIYLARQKSSLTAERIATDNAFERTRENNAEFGRAGKAGKLLRTAFGHLLYMAKDGSTVSRLVKLMMMVIKSDVYSMRGWRKIEQGNTGLLQGFSFNRYALLNWVLTANFVSSINRFEGIFSVNLPMIYPLSDLISPKEATHFKVVSAGGAINFANNTFKTSYTSSEFISLNQNNAVSIELMTSIAPDLINPCFLLLGIQFYQEINGIPFILKNSVFNALEIINVDSVNLNK